MTIQHINIADADRHEAKGASTATEGQVLRANGNGTTSFVIPSTLRNITMSNPITASSLVDQGPSQVDDAYQVKFGDPAANTNVTIDVDGVATFLVEGLYDVKISLSFGRTGTTATSILLYRILINGSAYGPTKWVQIDESLDTTMINETFIRPFSVNDTITVEVVRDGDGENDGGLISFEPSEVDWTPVPSASITIKRISGGY